MNIYTKNIRFNINLHDRAVVTTRLIGNKKQYSFPGSDGTHFLPLLSSSLYHLHPVDASPLKC